MRDFIEYVTKQLVDQPDDVIVTEETKDDAIVYTLKVADNDIGKVIGKKGKTAFALRILTSAVNKKAGKKAFLKIHEKDKSQQQSPQPSA